MNENPLIAVLGPTAAGKSGLGIELARRFDGEVVNFDSVQVYRGFNVGSAKTPPEERAGIPHHLLDVLDPAEQCSAGDFARMGREVLEDIRARGKTPVLVGGTGFYFKALVEGLFEGPARDDDLRERLASVAERGRLHRLLQKLDPESAQRIHANDTPKLVRAVEVCMLARRPLSAAHSEEPQPLSGFLILRLGLDPPRDELYERINRRSRVMFDGGLLEEVRGLLDAGIPRTAWAFGALGYRQALAVLDGRITLDEAVEQTAQATRNYAKRQLTWFRRQEPKTVWYGGFGGESRTTAFAVSTTSQWFDRSQ